MPPKNSALLRQRWMRTELYSSHQINYVRFRWGKGSETWGYVHVSGGACTSDVVQSRRKAVEDLIASDADLEVVLSLLRSFENARAGRKPKGELDY